MWEMLLVQIHYRALCTEEIQPLSMQNTAHLKTDVRASLFSWCDRVTDFSSGQLQAIFRATSCQTTATIFNTFANIASCPPLSDKVHSDQQASVICCCRWVCFQAFSEYTFPLLLALQNLNDEINDKAALFVHWLLLKLIQLSGFLTVPHHETVAR